MPQTMEKMMPEQWKNNAHNATDVIIRCQHQFPVGLSVTPPMSALFISPFKRLTCST